MTSKTFFDDHLNGLQECVKLASDEIMEIYCSENYGQEEKSDGSPLTLADKRSNEIILSALKKISKDISIISEETFNESLLKSLKKTYWLVDPCVKKLRIVMSKSHKSELDRDFLMHLKSNNIAYETVEKGSSLKLCSLADNEADIYPRFGPTSEWDIAAAHAVLSSMGGCIMRVKDNEELGYAKKESILNPHFIAFRNNSIKNEYLPVLGDFLKKLV